MQASNAEPGTAEALGWQLRAALPPIRLHSVSIYDSQANVLWLSEGALGPDEHSLVLEALETLNADSGKSCCENGLEDGRIAAFLAVRAPQGHLVGIAMVLAEFKSPGEGLTDRIMSAPTRTIMQKLAVLLRPAGSRKPDADPTALVLSLAAADVPATASVPQLKTAPPPSQLAATAKSTPARTGEHEISECAVNDILEFELTDADSVSLRVPVGTIPADTTSAQLLKQPVPTTDTTSARLLKQPAPTTDTTGARLLRQPVTDTGNSRTLSSPTATGAARALSLDPTLVTLEMLPFVKLRSGGRIRRFEVLPTGTARELRDPAVLDSLAMQRLLAWLGTHRAAWTVEPSSFTLNLSIATLEDEGFLTQVAAGLQNHGIAPDAVGFEIAEPLCTQRRAQVEHFMAGCEKLGCFVVIDDFSFDSAVVPLLRSRALRLVKIDARLTSSALRDKLSQALVVAVVQAVKVLGMHCAAQQVDSQASLQWLSAVGCDFAQGPMVARQQRLETLLGTPS
ncbi:MAG TPA: EAL domain-containing protein [Steroidobacteraceae bacterium]|jgi:EAL domain-containing protein (putative c-di-GMP-specific phosphodiesterase class I)